MAGLVGAGLGASAVPAGVLPLMSFTSPAVRPLAEPEISRRVCLLSHSVLTPAAQRFQQALISAFRHTGAARGRSAPPRWSW